MLLNSDARSIPLADGCVQCVVTSPPYWGLRKYKGAMTQVFGGVAGCAHEWGDEVPSRGRSGWHTFEHKYHSPGSHKTTIGSTMKKPAGESNQGSFCRLCGAWRGELGLEPTPEMYVEHIVEVFREVRRVLRDDGVIFLNLGDSYATQPAGNKVQQTEGPWQSSPKRVGKLDEYNTRGADWKSIGLKPKDLCGIPWRVAFALQADGWYLRSDIIWSKPNPMPESLNGWRWEQHRVKVEAGNTTVGVLDREAGKASWTVYSGQGTQRTELSNPKWVDCPGCAACEPNGGLVLRRGSWRPTKSHEYLFMLAKSDSYFADADAVRERNTPAGEKRLLSSPVKLGGNKNSTRTENPFSGVEMNQAVGRNRRTVWQIATAPYSGAHFATFPPALVEPCILAGTSGNGCCPECGSSWARVVYKKRMSRPELPKDDPRYRPGRYEGKLTPIKGEMGDAGYTDITTLAWRPTCSHNLEPVPSLVLDPFCGSGTTLLVARKLGRRGVGCDLSLPYLRDQARKRLGLDKLAAWQNGGKEVETRLQGLPMWAECAE